MLTKNKIERLKNLLAKLPDEEWQQAVAEEMGCDYHEPLPFVETVDGLDVCCSDYRATDEENLALAEFIADSRQSIPALIETIEEQRKRIQLYLDGVTLDREPPYNETVGQRFERREQLQQICTELKECLK